jgi:hypothetical protein
MHRGYRFLSSLVLTATIASPVAMLAAARQQEGRDQENRQGENNRRYYDRRHKDYHTWDSREDNAYLRYQTERHQRRPFIQLNTRQQTIYWNWRHSNPDRDDR